MGRDYRKKVAAVFSFFRAFLETFVAELLAVAIFLLFFLSIATFVYFVLSLLFSTRADGREPTETTPAVFVWTDGEANEGEQMEKRAQTETGRFVVQGGGGRSDEIARECDAIADYLEERFGAVDWGSFPVVFGSTPAGIAGYCRSDSDEVREIRIGVGYDNSLGAALDHELTHAYVVYKIGSGSNLFWNEGTAQNAEYASRERYRKTIYRRMKADDVSPIRDLIERDGYDTRFRLYNQSFSVVDFLIARGGSQWFIAFFEESERSGVDEALKLYYGYADVEALENDWKRYVRQGQDRSKARTVLEDCQR